MTWQYVAVAAILLVVACVVVVKVLRKRCSTPGSPFCAGCALAKSCKKRRR